MTLAPDPIFKVRTIGIFLIAIIEAITNRTKCEKGGVQVPHGVTINRMLISRISNISFWSSGCPPDLAWRLSLHNSTRRMSVLKLEYGCNPGHKFKMRGSD